MKHQIHIVSIKTQPLLLEMEHLKIVIANAFEVLFDGSTTIAGNVTAPAFIGDGSQLTNIPFKYSSSGNQGIQSPTNTASGYLSIAMGINTQSSGEYSTAMGKGAIASGGASTAMGDYTTASGYASTASGQGTTASGNYSTALGINTTATKQGSFAVGADTVADGNESSALGIASGDYSIASGDYSTAMGYETKASSSASIAMGFYTTASSFASTAMGDYTEASGGTSTAMGYFTKASGFASTAMGEGTEASGWFSTTMGRNTTAQDYGTTAIGVFNETKETPNPDNFSYQNTAFVIGNGSVSNRSNAFKVLFDGTTTIAGDLNINSDARLKANIISLGATLSKLLQIDGKTYTMKKDANHKKKIGLLAQDIEKVFPELVTETNDIKSVNYQGLVPVLINAMKEQDEVIRSQDSRLISQETKLSNQEAKLNKQQQEIDELKAMVKALAKG